MIGSIRGRLTLWYGAALAAVLVAFSAISYLLLAHQIAANTDASLADTAHEFIAAFSESHTPAAGAPNAGSVLLDYRYSDRQIIVFDGRGLIVATSRLHTLSPEAQQVLLSSIARGFRGFITLDMTHPRRRVRALALPLVALGQTYTVVVTRSLHEQEKTLALAFRSLFLGIPFALLIAMGGGYLIARKSLGPVVVMSRKAREIGAETLNERIAVANEADELGGLANTLNDLLSRLQGSFQTQRRFMADASHELRTPLAILQGEADVALAREKRSAEEYREALEIIRNAARRLTRIVQNLFMLAQTDAGRYPIAMRRFYLDELVAECVTSFRTVASEKRITLSLAPAGEMLAVGDEELIHRLVLNLIDNAVKYTQSDGSVTVALEESELEYRIAVADSGLGISEEDRPHVFERFYRADRARRRGGSDELGGSGAGLGLPIALWIAEIHGGSLVLQHSDAQGTTFVARLPRKSEGTVEA